MKDWDWSRWRSGIALGLVGGILVFGVVMAIRAMAPPGPTPGEDKQGKLTLNHPGLVRPNAVPAAAARVKDADSVIGVLVRGRARAYLVAALSVPETHVINDVVAGRPVTVTYCGLKNCVRVFTDDGTGPLNLGVGGYDDGLLLLMNGRRYRQESGNAVGAGPPLPFPTLDFVRVTWKEWREAHPDTDVVDTTAIGG